MMQAQIAEALRNRAARLRAADETAGGSDWGYVPNVLVRLADEIEAGLDEQVQAVEELRSRLRHARGADEDRAGIAPEQVGHEAVGALGSPEAVLTAIRLALNEEGGVRGWRPPRGVDPVLDLALDVREERDRLRGAR